MSQKKKFQIPHVFVILVMIVIFATAMTYIIPAGEFARVKNEATGKMIVDATSFTWVEQCPVSFFKIPNYIVKALAGSSQRGFHRSNSCDRRVRRSNQYYDPQV